MKLADQGSTLPGQGSGAGKDLGSPAGHQEELVDEGFLTTRRKLVMAT